MRIFNDTDALITAGFQYKNGNVYGEVHGADEDTVMAAEITDLWLCVISEYVRTFMLYEFGYPLRFASLLQDRPVFPAKLKSIREHYSLVLKYERLAITDMEIRSFLKLIGFLSKPSVRVSWILWSAASEDKLSFEEQDIRARLINDGRFGGLGDTYANECSNAILRAAEKDRIGHMCSGGETHHKANCVSRQCYLNAGPTLKSRRVPEVEPLFENTENPLGSIADYDRHNPPAGVCSREWLSMMKSGVHEFRNPVPEADRVEVAAWMWLLEYDKSYSSLPPHDRPAIGQGWLAVLCLEGLLVEQIATGMLYLCLGNETWMTLLLPLRSLGSNLYAIAETFRLGFGFVSSLSAWRVHPSKCVPPSMVKSITKMRRGRTMIAWQITGPPVPLLRAALEHKISLNVEDMITLLGMLKCDVPKPARKGECLRNILNAVFTDWTAEQIREHWEAMITAPTLNQKAENDLDEDLMCCLKHHLPQAQQEDYKAYTDAIERIEIAARLKLKRRMCDNDGDALVFDWGPFHFWKRPPTKVKHPHGGWAVTCGPHHRGTVGDSREVVCSRECGLRHEGDEDLTIRRLKMWALGHCCCATKEQHHKYMRDYPADDQLLTHEASRGPGVRARSPGPRPGAGPRGPENSWGRAEGEGGPARPGPPCSARPGRLGAARPAPARATATGPLGCGANGPPGGLGR